MTAAMSALILAKQQSGKKLYVFAWVIEGIAAFIGLMIAWSMGFQTYQFYVNEYGSFPLINLFDLVLAALPFVMVASVELLKIPFCKLIYLNRSFKIRVLFSIVLVLVTFITFETLITGFERQFNNISIQVNERNGKVIGALQASNEGEIFLISNKGTLVRTKINEISLVGRNTQGVRLIKLDDGSKISSVTKVVKEEEESPTNEEQTPEE